MMKKVLLNVLLCFSVMGCAVTPANYVHDQAAVIEHQQQTLSYMGDVIGAVRADLTGARTDLERAIGEAEDLRSIFAIIDGFVRSVIEAEQLLESLQPTDSGEDAGEG
jgi:TolA-binding protein